MLLKFATGFFPSGVWVPQNRMTDRIIYAARITSKRLRCKSDIWVTGGAAQAGRHPGLPAQPRRASRGRGSARNDKSCYFPRRWGVCSFKSTHLKT